MPAEKFWAPTRSGDDAPDHVITWGDGAVYLDDMPMDRSALNRMIRALRRARDTAYGKDE